jgi:hypothetical protein
MWYNYTKIISGNAAGGAPAKPITNADRADVADEAVPLLKRKQA